MDNVFLALMVLLGISILLTMTPAGLAALVVGGVFGTAAYWIEENIKAKRAARQAAQ